jgi:hypothetical protein
MNTLQIDLTYRPPDFGPACTKCAGRTRLIGIEPHPTRAHTDLRTFECMACDAVRAIVVPLAS